MDEEQLHMVFSLSQQAANKKRFWQQLKVFVDSRPESAYNKTVI